MILFECDRAGLAASPASLHSSYVLVFNRHTRHFPECQTIDLLLYFILAAGNKGEVVADDPEPPGIRNSACHVAPLKSGHLLGHMGLRYLRGKVWVASGEAGHDPDITGSYQAQGPSFLQYIPAEQSRRGNKNLRFTFRKSGNEIEKHSHGLVLGAVEQYNRTLDPLEGNV